MHAQAVSELPLDITRKPLFRRSARGAKAGA
jgi:hypothetical protein